MISPLELKLISTGIISASIVGTLIYVSVQKTINRKYSGENLIISGNEDNKSKGYRFPYLTEENRGRFIYDQNKYKNLDSNPKDGYMLRDECFLLLKKYSFNLESEKKCLFKVDEETEKLFHKYLSKLNKSKKNSGKVYLEIMKESTEQINYLTEDFEKISRRFNNKVEKEIEEQEYNPIF